MHTCTLPRPAPQVVFHNISRTPQTGGKGRKADRRRQTGEGGEKREERKGEREESREKKGER